MVSKKKRRNSNASLPLTENDVSVGTDSTVDDSSAAATVDTNGNDVVPCCEHSNKKSMIQMSVVRKKMKEKSFKLGECEGCRRAANKVGTTEEGDVWLCMLCGHQGCGRYTDDQHALKHYNSVETSIKNHPLAFNLRSRHVWCYACDKKIEPNGTTKGSLKEFLDNVQSLLKSYLPTAAQNSVELAVAADEVESTSNEDGGKGTLKKKGSTAKTEKEVVNTGVMPVKGLSNLGNTCFFNSVMQCLAQTHHLKASVDEVTHDNHRGMRLRPTAPIPATKSAASDDDADASTIPEPLDVVLEDDPGALTQALADFLRKFSVERSVNPSNLFNHVVRKAPRFRGYAQQDSHELLRYLLDGLRCEEQARIQEAIKRSMGLNPDVKRNAVDARTASIAKAYFESAGRPRLDRVFGGSLLQSIECSECGHLSQKLEHFLDISVPVVIDPLPVAKSKDDDLDNLLADNRGPSKHQKKKERQASRKGKRTKKNSSSEPTTTATEGVAATQADGTAIVENGVAHDSNDSETESIASNIDETVDSLVNGVDQLGIDSDENQSVARQRTDMLASADCHKWQTERNLGACLKQFIAVESLTGKNRYECERCCLPANKKLRDAQTEKEGDAKTGRKKSVSGLKNVEATKRYLVYSPPAVLTIHLKRFQQTPVGRLGRTTTRKFSGRVEFPLLLDLAPFCSKRAQRINSAQQRVLYALYGVVSHSGDLGGGHYVAFIKARGRDQPMIDHFLSAATKPDELQAESTKTETDDCSGVSGDAPRFTPSSGEWYYASDSTVSKVSESKVLAAEAYILFYERIQ